MKFDSPSFVWKVAIKTTTNKIKQVDLILFRTFEKKLEKVQSFDFNSSFLILYSKLQG